LECTVASIIHNFELSVNAGKQFDLVTGMANNPAHFVVNKESIELNGSIGASSVFYGFEAELGQEPKDWELRLHLFATSTEKDDQGHHVGMRYKNGPYVVLAGEKASTKSAIKIDFSDGIALNMFDVAYAYGDNHNLLVPPNDPSFVSVPIVVFVTKNATSAMKARFRFMECYDHNWPVWRTAALKGYDHPASKIITPA